MPRTRLLARIGQPVPAPITLISAPAGFGKTTLATQWTQLNAGRVAWLSLTAAHEDLDRLLLDLSRALFAGADVPAGTITLNALCEHLRDDARERPVTIVLDDVHRVSGDEVLRSIEYLLSARIPNVRWLVLSRAASPYNLARLRMEGQVREIGMEDLAFTRAEIAEVTRLIRGRDVPDGQAERLAAFTGGWIAGIRLTLGAAGAGPVRDEGEGRLGAVAREWIDSYLSGEVLDVLPRDVREFALRTCWVPYLSPDFAIHVSGTGGEAAFRLLALLEANFILRRQTVESGSTLEYAPWILPSLRRIAIRRLPAELRADIHERIAGYLFDHDQYALALEHARRVDDLSLRTRIVRILHTPLALQDRTVLIRTLLETLPGPVIRQHPDLAYSYAHALFHRGDSTALVSHVSKILPVWRLSDDSVVRGYAMNCRAFILQRMGDTSGALRLFSEALTVFPETLYRERLHALAGVFEHASDMGDDATAERALADAASCIPFLPRHQVTWWMNMQSRWAEHHALRGQIALAGELYEYGLKNTPPTFTEHRPYFWYRIAGLRLQANELAQAEELIVEALEVIEERGPDDWHANAMALAALVAYTRGERTLAESRLREAHAIASRLGNQHDLMQIETMRAAWDIQAGDLVAARAWDIHWQPYDRGWIQQIGQVNAIATLMQMRIAEARFDDAISIGEAALVEGQRRKRHVEMISIMMWIAVAYERAGDREQATAMLEQALMSRRDRGVVRAFVTLGYDFSMWQRERLSPEARAVFDDLSARLGETIPGDRATGKTVDTLTARERDVLGLLARGLANQEISHRLFITERTVKKHVSNILRKLEMPNRTAIVLHAREQGWLGE
ncbi:MAG TPA: LuxR C-terminal-related transcriptional regulator [Thermomicrobiales bacterium]|nr:LuxR C-terminal-related transcriptional regulator [Thermomicrobiales bacterium]